MTKVNDTTYTDLLGAVKTLEHYLKEVMGFDSSATKCEIDVETERGCIVMRGYDKFQEGAVNSADQVGRIYHFETFSHDEEFEAAIGRCWTELNKCMMRDERELRHIMTLTGHLIEGGQFETGVGKMLAERIKAVRADCAKYLPIYARDNTDTIDTIDPVDPVDPKTDDDDEIPY